MLKACLKTLREGDTLVAWKLDQLGRDLRHLVNLVHELTSRSVGLKVLAGQGANLDTTAANGRQTKVGVLCADLGVTRQTLYRHVDPNGALWPDGEKLLGRIC